MNIVLIQYIYFQEFEDLSEHLRNEHQGRKQLMELCFTSLTFTLLYLLFFAAFVTICAYILLSNLMTESLYKKWT